MIKTININALTLCCSIALLSACSSSSDDDNTAKVPADAIAITADNALEKIQTSSASIESAFSALDATTDALLPEKTSRAVGTKHFSDFARALLNKNKISNTTPTGVSANDTVPCDSGTLKYSVDFTSTTSTEKANGTVTFNSCVFNTSSINGSFKFSYTDDFSGTYLKSSGSDSSSSLIFIVDGISHTFKNFKDTWSDDESTQIATQSSTFSYSSTAINGGILVQDTTPHQEYYYDFYPFTGVTLITGANNSKLRITYLDTTQFKLEVDEDGDGVFEYIQTVAWIDIATPGTNTPVIARPTLPADAITITQTNADEVAQTAKSTLKDAFSFIDLNTMPAKTSSSSSRHLLLFADLVRNISNNSKSANLNLSSTTTSETIVCDSGYATINVVTNDLQTSATGSLIFSNCVFAKATINGSLNFTHTYTESFSAGQGLNYSSSLTITVDGVIHQFTDFQDTWSYDNATSISTSSSTFSYSSQIINGGILVEDISTIQHRYADLYPFAGSTLITGADNTKLRFTHLNEQEYSVEVDEDGDDTFEFSQSYIWPEFNY